MTDFVKTKKEKHSLVNIRKHIKRATVISDNGVVLVVVMWNDVIREHRGNGTREQSTGFNTISGAKKFFSKHYLNEIENIWRLEL